VRIGKRINAEKKAKALADAEKSARKAALDEEKAEEEGPKPNPKLEIGKKMPNKYGVFPPELFGRPIEDVDEFYKNRYVCSYIIQIFLNKT